MAEEYTSEEKEEQQQLLDYLEEISKYDREFKKWEARVEKIIKRYRDEGREARTNAQSRFNILWANVQTLIPATFAKLPMPDVSRRFRDNDPLGRVASLILERALDYELQHYSDYRHAIHQAVRDRFLGGRGTAWARYEPRFKTKAGETVEGEDLTGEQITDQQKPDTEATEILDYECTPIDYVHWRDFGHSVARTWDEVTCVWRKVYMNEEDVRKRFGDEIAEELPYDSSPDDLRKTARTAQENWKQQAIIYELWDKNEGCAYWLSKSYKNKFLDTREDPLGLQEFFPCPKPLFATLTNETLVPVPDFTLYQDQANELDVLQDRIDGLTKMLQLKGTYDSSTPELQRLFTEGENGTLIPVKNYAAFAEKGGLKGCVDIYDLTQLGEALKIAQEAMQTIKTQVYELTGIMDIMRGAEAPHEITATESKIGAAYGSLRLKAMQDQVATFATGLLQIKAQIMCSKYDPKTILTIAAADQLSPTDQQMIPQALALLVGQERMQNPEADAPNPLRGFRIEVVADSLIEVDEQQQKQDRTEFITAVGTYIQKVSEVVQQNPEAAPIALSLLKFGITAYKIGKALEGELDLAIDQMRQQAMMPKPPKVPPEVQAEQIKAQAHTQTEQQKVQAQSQMEQQRLQAQTQLESQKAQIQIQADREKTQFDLQKDEMERQMKEREAAREEQLERWKAELEAATKIQVAEITAKAGLDQVSAKANIEASEVLAVDFNQKAAEPIKEMVKSHGEMIGSLANAMAQTHGELKDTIQGLTQAMSKPKKVVRDAEGKVSGIE